MTDAAGSLARRAAALRLDFDRSFAEPERVDTAQKADFLAIRIDAEGCALRLDEIAGLYVDKKVTRVPGNASALLGIAGFRGAILPVYSLAALLGRTIAETPRWLVVAAAAPVALAFEDFHGHLRVAPDAVLPRQAAERHGYARDYVRAHSLVRPIIDLPSIVRAIGAGPSEAAQKQER